MESLERIEPYIRVAHHYRFPIERNASEAGRIGYCYAFHLIDGGKGKATAAAQTYPVTKGDLLYFPPGTKHAFYSDPDHPLSTYNIYCELWNKNEEAQGRHLAWDDKDFDPTWMTAVRRDADLDELPYWIPLQHHGAMTALFSHIVVHAQQSDPYSAAVAACLLKAFILELVQVSREQGETDYRIKRIMDRIDKDQPSISRMKEWILLSGLGKTQFYEAFKRTAGMPPKAYLTQAVMKQAAAALLESNRTVTGIAEDLGYSSIHHFTKQFTVYYGVSPTQYRKRRGAEQVQKS